MSIIAYTGLPGHGKSYGVVENVIAPALKAKRTVYSNIPMNTEECLSRFGMAPTFFDIQDILENPNWWSEVFEPGSIIVIDELWRLWPSGLKATNVREQDKSFLAEHRHMVGENGQSTEVIFVTQDLSQIAAFSRSLVETTFRVTKLSKMGLNKRYRVDVYFGPVTGVSPPVSKREREIQGSFKKSIYSLYKSHTKSITGAAGDETRTDGRFNALGRMSIKLGVAAFVVCSIGAYYGLKHLNEEFFGDGDASLPESSTLQAATLSSGQPVPLVDSASALVSRKDKFLSLAESIYISWNNGHFPKIDYRYTVTLPGSRVVLSNAELAVLQYDVRPISQCMVKITGPDYVGFALCARDKESQSWVEGLVTNTAGITPI